MRNGRAVFAGWWKAAVLAAIVIAPVALVTITNAQNASTTSRRLTRELSIMEKVIDEMLLDSRNFLVYSTDDNTRGLYLEEFGVLFSFQASLVSRGGDFKFDWKDFNIQEKDGVIVISPPEDDPDEKQDRKKDRERERDRNRNSSRNDDEDGDDHDHDHDHADRFTFLKGWRERNSNVQQRLYTDGKAEVLDILLDYGDSMTSLRDTQWLGIAAFLKRSDFFIDKRISRLVIKAKMSDLRAYADHRIDREAMKKRVVVEEY